MSQRPSRIGWQHDIQAGGRWGNVGDFDFRTNVSAYDRRRPVGLEEVDRCDAGDFKVRINA